MESYDPFEVRQKGRSASQAPYPDAGPGADARSHAALVRHVAQAERAVMHPDRYDLEWRYCRGGWAG